MIETKREEHQETVTVDMNEIKIKISNNEKRLLDVESLLDERANVISGVNVLLCSEEKNFDKESIAFIMSDAVGLKVAYGEAREYLRHFRGVHYVAEREKGFLLEHHMMAVLQGGDVDMLRIEAELGAFYKKYTTVLTEIGEELESMIREHLLFDEKRVVNGVAFYEEMISSLVSKYSEVSNKSKKKEKSESYMLYMMNVQLSHIKARSVDADERRKELLGEEKSSNVAFGRIRVLWKDEVKNRVDEDEDGL